MIPKPLTTADFLARQIAIEEELFASDTRSAAELMARIAADPTSKVVGGDLSRAAQQVAELVRRAAKIAAWRETHGLMSAEAVERESEDRV